MGFAINGISTDATCPVIAFVDLASVDALDVGIVLACASPVLGRLSRDALGAVGTEQVLEGLGDERGLTFRTTDAFEDSSLARLPDRRR